MARTANRGTMSASSPTSYNVMRWRLGKYIRLSKEDLLRGRDESNSVVNQRRLLEQYHQAHLDEFYEGAEADVYVDDGKTGTDTNREDFQRLLSDISSGRINCVIVKDLSRDCKRPVPSFPKLYRCRKPDRKSFRPAQRPFYQLGGGRG